MKFIVEYEGWLEVEAKDESEARGKGFMIINHTLSPICDGGRTGDWEISNVEEDEAPD